MFIGLHFAYFFEARHYIKSKNRIHIYELHYGDDKPDGMPGEVWEKVQALLSITQCPDKLRIMRTNLDENNTKRKSRTDERKMMNNETLLA